MKKSLKKAKGKAKKDNKNLQSLNKEEIQDVSGGAEMPKVARKLR